MFMLGWWKNLYILVNLVPQSGLNVVLTTNNNQFLMLKLYEKVVSLYHV